MPVYTLAPLNGTFNTYQFAGADRVAAISDALDTTSVAIPDKSSAMIYAKLALPTSPTGELVSVVPTVRIKTTEVGIFLRLGVARRDGSAWVIRNIATAAVPVSFADFVGVAQLGNVLLWGLADVADAYIFAQRSAYGANIEVAKAGGVAYYLAPSTVAAPSAPAGIIDDQTPTQTATVSSVVESWQQTGWLCGNTVEMAVYKSADATGADPPTGVTPEWTDTVRATISTYGDGATPTTQAVSMDADSGLSDGDYITFARVSRDLPAGQGLYWSAWSKSAAAWTIATDPPDAPTALTATADDEIGLVAIAVAAPATAGYEAGATSHVQRSDDLGATWGDVVGLIAVPITLGGGTTAIGNDYRAPAGSTTLQYRARVTAEATATGDLVVSAWITISGVTGPAVFAGWRFVPLDDPDSAWSGASVIGEGSEETTIRDVAIFAPLDGANDKVVSGPSRGVAGTYTFGALGATEAASLAALVAQTGVILATSPLSVTRLIAWAGPPTILYLGTLVDPVTQASIDYVETDIPG